MSTIERDGRTFGWIIEPDDRNEPPWTQEDGHGPVTDWTTRDKQPGERVLITDRRSKRFYDFAEACRIARRDGWGVNGGQLPNESAKAYAARAVEADYTRLSAWCNGVWSYVGVVLVPLCTCCGEGEPDYFHALWGVESDADDYLETVAGELVDQYIADSEPSADCCDA